MARIFWRAGAPWVLVRGDDGQAFAVPWVATDLPAPVGPAADPGDLDAPLLSPTALRALARFVCRRRAGAPEPRGRSDG